MSFRTQLQSLLILTFFLPAVLVAERFSLDVPGQPGLRSVAEIQGASLVILDASGQKYTYVRDKNADSRDRQFWGYYSAELRRYVRFPVAGKGALQFADKDGTRVWRTSQMRVSRMGGNAAGAGARPPVGNPALPFPPGSPNLDPFFPGIQGGGAVAPPAGVAFHAVHFAVLPEGDAFHIGVLDRRGDFHFYFGRGTQWQKQTTRPLRAIDFEGSFVLAPNPKSRIPTVYGVSTRGELLAVTNGREVRSVFANRRDAPRFVRNTQLSSLDEGRLILAVDDRSRCLLISGADGRFVDAGPFRSRAVPGSPVSAVHDLARRVHVFLIDGVGQLLQLSLQDNGGWSEEVLGRHYAPGGHVAVKQLEVAGRARQIYLATVNSRGLMELFREPFRHAVTLGAGKFVPGAPLALSRKRGGELALAAVDHRGALAEWVFAGTWQKQEIEGGFAAGAPLWFDGQRAACFAINRQGTLISGFVSDGHWMCHHCGVVAGLVGYVPPTIVRSELVPLETLPPVEIRLQNVHEEDLVIQWSDTRYPRVQPETLEIPAGGMIRRQVNRDAGAKRVETVRMQRLDGTLVEEVREYVLPAKPLYTLAVFENRIQSVYIDRTGKDPTPGSVTKGLRSVGVFRLPPGELLRDGQVINVYEEAAARRNPGAVRLVP